MTHLTDGELRRLYDEPLAVAESARGHFNQCSRCRERLAVIAGDARTAQAALAVPAITVDPAAAFHAISGRLEQRRLPWLPRLSPGGTAPRRRAVLAAALLAATLSLVAFAQPLASGLTQIFSPKQVATVPITQGSLEGLPDLSNWGTVKVITQPELQQVDSAQQAAGSDLPVLPGARAGLPAPQYARIGQGSATFTFDSAKAAAAAQREGKKAPPLPSKLNGSVLQLTAGPAEVAVYGSLDPKQVQNGQVPQLVVAAGLKPVLTSNGATVQEIEDAVLAQPGVSPQLAAEIRAIGDPASTLPIPIPANMATSHPVTLADGKTQATFIGDNTGVAAGLIWIKGNYVYAVGGSLHESELVAVANGLV